MSLTNMLCHFQSRACSMSDFGDRVIIQNVVNFDCMKIKIKYNNKTHINYSTSEAVHSHKIVEKSFLQ